MVTEPKEITTTLRYKTHTNALHARTRLLTG